MNINELDQHCGECSAINYCGNGWGYCLCSDARFNEIDEAVYAQIADGATPIKPYEACIGCAGDHCDYLPDKQEACEHNDNARDYFCEQVADYVEVALAAQKYEVAV